MGEILNSYIRSSSALSDSVQIADVDEPLLGVQEIRRQALIENYLESEILGCILVRLVPFHHGALILSCPGEMIVPWTWNESGSSYRIETIFMKLGLSTGREIGHVT